MRPRSGASSVKECASQSPHQSANGRTGASDKCSSGATSDP